MSVQEKLNKLLWNKRYIEIPDHIERPRGLDYVMIRDLTVENRNYFSFVKEREELAARKSGVPTEAELMQNARLAGHWTDTDDKILTDTDSLIAYLEHEFEAKKKFKSRQNIIVRQIEEAKKKKEEVLNKQSQLFASSADYYAHEVACLELLRLAVLDLNGRPLIDSDQKLLEFKHDYPHLIYFLIKDIMQEGTPAIEEIREIARSVEWRLVWCLNRENLDSLFGCQVRDLNLRYRLLIYWSRIYDSAIESPEPPERDVINDDKAFDQWLANRELDQKEKKNDEPTIEHLERGRILDGEYVQHCNCGAKETNKTRYLGEKVQHAHTCPFGTWHQYSLDEKKALADKIYGRNSDRVRKLIDNEQETIIKRGTIEEQHLRGKKTRLALNMPTKVIPIHKR